MSWKVSRTPLKASATPVLLSLAYVSALHSLEPLTRRNHTGGSPGRRTVCSSKAEERGSHSVTRVMRDQETLRSTVKGRTQGQGTLREHIGIEGAPSR